MNANQLLLLDTSAKTTVSSAAEKTNQAPQRETCGGQSGAEERGDLIQFYNAVFVLKVKGFAMRYAASENHRVTDTLYVFTCQCLCVSVLHLLTTLQAEAPPLSPFPSVRAQPLSPRRVSQRHSLYVSPHKSSPGGLNYLNPVTYRINRSPSKVSTQTHANVAS